MNEVARIRLGRIAYDIDINAKKELEKYSRAIRKSLGQDSDVYDDIEIRMTEILADQDVQAGEVITLDDVLAIESQLGQPGDFASDSNNSGAAALTLLYCGSSLSDYVSLVSALSFWSISLYGWSHHQH